MSESVFFEGFQAEIHEESKLYSWHVLAFHCHIVMFIKFKSTQAADYFDFGTLHFPKDIKSINLNDSGCRWAFGLLGRLVCWSIEIHVVGRDASFASFHQKIENWGLQTRQFHCFFAPKRVGLSWCHFTARLGHPEGLWLADVGQSFLHQMVYHFCHLEMGDTGDRDRWPREDRMLGRCWSLLGTWETDEMFVWDMGEMICIEIPWRVRNALTWYGYLFPSWCG